MNISAGSVALRRMVFGYLSDLAVAIAAMMLVGRVWGVPIKPSATPWVLQRLIEAVDPLTPTALWQSYNEVLTFILEALPHDLEGGPGGNAMTVLQLLWAALSAIPETLQGIYYQGDRLQSAVCIFALLLALAIFGVLAAAAHGSRVRMTLAALVTLPITALMLGLLEQALLLLAVLAAGLAAIAPWWLVCPILASAWWLVVPGASRGAVATLLHAIFGRPAPGPDLGLP